MRVYEGKVREKTGGPMMSLTDMGYSGEATWMGWGGGGKIMNLVGDRLFSHHLSLHLPPKAA